MILIQVQLATVSIISLALALLSVCPAVLGLILGVHEYCDVKSLQVPSCLAAAAEILLALTQLYGVLSPYQLTYTFASCASILLTAATGLYYVGMRITSAVEVHERVYRSGKNRVEVAFVCLWLVSLISAACLTLFCVGATWIAEHENELMENPGQEDEMKSPMTASSDQMGSLRIVGKPSSGQSQQSLGSPVDIPTVGTYPIDQQPLSPRLSWPSSVNSIRQSGSLSSLRSALDNRNTTPPQQTLQYQAAQPPVQQQSYPLQQIQYSRSRTLPTGNPSTSPHELPAAPTPSATKPPKTPLKIHLTKSSFSLKRSPSKASQHNHTKHSSSNKGSPTESAHAMAPSLETLPLQIPMGLSMFHDNGTQKNWVMIPNENSAESRSVSGSSQLTGRVFPAAEYNRKINSAGFQRDEPVPVQVQLVSPRKSYSQYDIERLHKQNKGSQ